MKESVKMRFRISLIVLLSLVVVSSLQASWCLKCDQSTGYACFRSPNGTKSGCDTPSDAGCATWGTCTPSVGDDCNEDPNCDVFSLGRVLPMSNDLEVAAVTTVPSPPTKSLPAPTLRAAI